MWTYVDGSIWRQSSDHPFRGRAPCQQQSQTEVLIFGCFDYLPAPCPQAPCLPTRGTNVRSGANWIHEVKYGYQLVVAQDGKRVRYSRAAVMIGPHVTR